MTKIRRLLPILIVLSIGAFFRFYRIRDYLVFLGDEGRDVLVVKRIIIDHIFTLLGPVTSVGGMYLGPIYYYFMAPFLWLFHFDPVGPAVMVALIGVATIYLVYKTGKDFFNEETGIFASLLYATSPTVIIYSRSSWNPNILPFFSLLIIYSLLNSFIKQKWNWLFMAGFAFGVSLQLHYIALFFSVIFLTLFILKAKEITLKRLGIFSIGLLSSFWLFIFFEIRHSFTNTLTIIQFITKPHGANFSAENFLVRFIDIVTRIFFRTVVIENYNISQLVVILLLCFSILYLYQSNKKKINLSSDRILIIWLLVGSVAYSLYQGAVYDYYFTAIFALPFLIIGLILSTFFRKGVMQKIAVLVVVLVILTIHIRHSPAKIVPNRLLDQSENIARFIFEKANNKPYNLALISTGNSDHAYRYYLELWGNPPVTIKNQELDPTRQTVMDQLLIVCEQKVCQPLGHSLWEIAGYGPAEVEGVWDIFPVKIIRLIPTDKNEKA